MISAPLPVLAATILVVEDDEGTRTLIRRRLEREGLLCASAANGEEALSLSAQIEGPALLLLDHQLPDMNAPELVRRMRDRGEDRPFVVMTGHGDERVAVELMKLGAWDYLVKDESFLARLPLAAQRAQERLLRELELTRVVAESDRRHRDMLQQLQDGLAVIDADCRIVETNERLRQIMQIDPEHPPAAQCRVIADFFGASCNRDHDCMIREVLSSGQARKHLYRYRSEDGAPRWADAMFSPLRDSEGRPRQVVLAIRDVTELKNLSDEQELIIQVSALLNRSTQRSEAMRDLLEHLKRWSGCDAVALRLAQGEDFPYYDTRGLEDSFVRSERHLGVRDEAGQPARDERGQPVLACLCGQVLQGRTEPGRPCFTAHGSFWTNSTTGLASRCEELALGAPLRNTCNAAGYESMALIPLRHRDRTLGLLQFVDRAQDRFSPDRVGMLENMAQQVALALAQYLAREELERREVELRHAQKMDSLGRLSSGIAHEINTPLQYLWDSLHFVRDAFENTLLRTGLEQGQQHGSAPGTGSDGGAREGSAELDAQDRAFLLEEIPRAFDRAELGLDRVRAIVRSMRQLSHPSGDRPGSADLNQLVRDALVVARNEYKYVAEVKTEFDELPALSCYASDLGQVLLNLLVNAAQAIAAQPGRGHSLGQIMVRTRLQEAWVELSVSDTGPGVPESLRKRLFEPFFTTKAPGMGTGQGLAIAYSIVVDRHGGSIHCEPSEAGGARFVVRLPTDGPPRRELQRA
jgi:PAS domain S-box-containing protein